MRKVLVLSVLAVLAAWVVVGVLSNQEAPRLPGEHIAWYDTYWWAVGLGAGLTVLALGSLVVMAINSERRPA